MKSFVMFAFLISGCGGGDVACETLQDCPVTNEECVLAMCIDGTCQDVDLATVSVLPVDPESGLPIGKHCRPACQCKDDVCQMAPEGAGCAFCDLVGVCTDGICVQVQAGPPCAIGCCQ